MVILAMPSPPSRSGCPRSRRRCVQVTAHGATHISLCAVEIDAWLARAPRGAPTRWRSRRRTERLTYAELLWRRRRARGSSRGAAAGTGGMTPAGRDFVVALHACLLAGAAAMPVDPRLGEREREGSCAAPGGQHPAGRGRRRAEHRRAARDVALVVHTSGTTGAPRAGRAHARQHRGQRARLGAALGLDPDERWLCPLPLSHVGGLMVLLRSADRRDHGGARPAPTDRPHAAGGDVTLASLVPDPARAPPRRRPAAAPRLRAVLLGGGPCPPALLGAPPPRASGRADLRAHRGLLAGHGRRARATSRPPAARSPAPASRWRPTARSSSPARPWSGGGRAAHRRPRPAGRPGPPDRHRPQVGDDRQRRRERRAGRGRGGARGAPAVAEAGVFARPTPSGARRWPRRRAAHRAPLDAEELRALCRGAAGRLQGPEGDRARRRCCRGPPRASCCAGRSAMTDPSEYRAQSRKRWGRAARAGRATPTRWAARRCRSPPGWSSGRAAAGPRDPRARGRAPATSASSPPS